jgi:hypothetical protein
VLETVGPQGLGQVGLDLRERRRVGREVDEDETGKDFHVQTPEPQRRAIEGRRHVRGSPQRAVEAVGPAVIAADEPRLVPRGLVADPRAAMPAHVEQRVHATVGGADDDDGLAGHLEQEIVPALRNLALVTDAEPGSQEDRTDLGLVEVVALVQRARQSVPRHVGLHQLLPIRIHARASMPVSAPPAGRDC